ncbi:response regulator transcription factor [Paenibacillus vini]|uniref:response regulator transcription factor n=1 Tax=Paenibacillus vini TaxID=1476024 RepID=UPI0025B6CF14|nr:response regulator transcription factor [Paenibacillus vini]MDN4070806.1 response regulator transcription factor [Paenibacillus vini]
MVQILLVDDHPSVMAGTKVLLEQEGDMVVANAETVEKALELVRQNHYDLMLLDLHMPKMNGIDLAKQIIAIRPEAVILIYTGFEFTNHFNLMMEAGISGFVLKTASKEQLVTAVRCALRGEAVLPLSLVRQMRRVSAQETEKTSGLETGVVTGKEYDILKQIARGKSNKAIAENLLVSQRSLEYSLTSLFHKLGVKSRIEAAMKAKTMGLLSDSDFSNPPV